MKLYQAAINSLQNLIAIPSFSREEKAAVDFFAFKPVKF
jgi:hypothetical protein